MYEIEEPKSVKFHKGKNIFPKKKKRKKRINKSKQ
jgi:hypothetical protein